MWLQTELDYGSLVLQRMDPQLRKLLEVTHEAWVDSGVDVKRLQGSDKARGSDMCLNVCMLACL